MPLDVVQVNRARFRASTPNEHTNKHDGLVSMVVYRVKRKQLKFASPGRAVTFSLLVAHCEASQLAVQLAGRGNQASVAVPEVIGIQRLRPSHECSLYCTGGDRRSEGVGGRRLITPKKCSFSFNRQI